MNNEQWSLSIGEAISLVGTDNFYSSLCKAFNHIPEVEPPLLLYYSKNAQPTVLFTSYSNKKEYVQQVENLITGPYILDPFFQASSQGMENGAYQLKEIAPDNFKKTEYYRKFFRTIGYNDEVTIIQTLPNNAFAHLSLVCDRGKKHFSKKIVTLLKEISPVINALILKHWEMTLSNEGEETSLDFHDTLERSWLNFGSSFLTIREQEVLQLVLHGHSNKSTAAKLDITLSTVKLHRKNIYKKLDISSQAELFYLFIDSLSSISSAHVSDPLQSYMKVQELDRY